MDFKAVIDFNKYTIALSAACFAYAVDKFSPMPTAGGRVLLVCLLTVFFLCTFFGVIIFAAATSAQSPDKAGKVDVLKRLIGPLGQLHLLLLVIGLVVLGGMLFERVMVPEEAAKNAVCCEACVK